MRRVLIVTAFVAGSVLLAAPVDAGGGCHGAGEKSGAGTTVELAMNCMNPRVLRAADGATITFVNRDAVAHNLYGEAWSVDELTQGESVTRSFPVGTHVYSCTLHPGMVGAVVVGDGVGSSLDAATPVRAVSDASSDDGDSGWLFGALAGALVGVAGTVGLRRLRAARA